MQAENAAYIIVRGSELTEQIAAQDNIRDTKMDEVTSVVNAMLRVASLPAMQQAAQVFKRGWDVYSPSAKAAYEAETTDLQQWHEDYLASADQQQAARTLGIEQIIADMMQANAEVHRLIVLRENTQGQQRTATTLKDARVQTDKAYKWMMLVLNSYHVVDANPARFDTVTSNLISQQDYYLGLVRERQRNNKRVSVKSDVVGRSTSGRLLPTGRKNHLYQTARDWTWARLIDDGKALLAIDPDQPARILSTDKKAQKAGGLCLALKGVPVKPTDDVDVDKEYQLIPLDSL